MSSVTTALLLMDYTVYSIILMISHSTTTRNSFSSLLGLFSVFSIFFPFSYQKNVEEGGGGWMHKNMMMMMMMIASSTSRTGASEIGPCYECMNEWKARKKSTHRLHITKHAQGHHRQQQQHEPKKTKKS